MRAFVFWMALVLGSAAFAQGRKGLSELQPATTAGMHPVQYVGGGVVGTFVGFGLGHLVQGRWLERGWIFSVAEPPLMVLGAAALFANSAHTGKSEPNGLAIFGAAFVGMRIWEAVDVWYTPYATAQQRTRRPSQGLWIQPEPGGGAQLVYGFNF